MKIKGNIMFKDQIIAQYDMVTLQITPIDKDKLSVIDYKNPRGLIDWLEQRPPLAI